MPRLYKEQTISQPQLDTVETLDLSGVDKQAVQLEKAYKKQIDSYTKSQVNNALGAIKTSYEYYKDSPEDFDKSVKNSIAEIEKTIPTDEEKIRFRSEMYLDLQPIRAKVDINFRNKANKQHREAYQVNAKAIIASTAGNMGLIQQGYEKEIQGRLGQLKLMAEQRDAYGNYVLSITDRAKINDMVENQGYYSFLSNIEEMKNAENQEGLDRAYNELKNNKKTYMDTENLTLEQYNDLLDATNSKQRNQTAQALKQVEIGVQVKNLNLGRDSETKQYIARNEKTDLIDVFNTIINLEEAYKNKEVKPSFYASNITNLKSAYYTMNMNKNKLFKKADTWHTWEKDTVGTNMLKQVELITDGLPIKGTELEAIKFDATKSFYENIQKAGINPDSTDATDMLKASKAILPITKELLLTFYSELRPKELEGMSQQQIKNVIQKYKNATNLSELQNVMDLGQNKKVSEFLGSRISL